MSSKFSHRHESGNIASLIFSTEMKITWLNSLAETYESTACGAIIMLERSEIELAAQQSRQFKSVIPCLFLHSVRTHAIQVVSSMPMSECQSHPSKKLESSREQEQKMLELELRLAFIYHKATMKSLTRNAHICNPRTERF